MSDHAKKYRTTFVRHVTNDVTCGEPVRKGFLEKLEKG